MCPTNFQQSVDHLPHLLHNVDGAVQHRIYDAGHREHAADDGTGRGQKVVPRLLHCRHQDLRANGTQKQMTRAAELQIGVFVMFEVHRQQDTGGTAWHYHTQAKGADQCIECMSAGAAPASWRR